ncbi:MAG TPA: hypothetical protein VN888_00960, partial [Mycobacterium sp.]|nr:hypothetical protein [Mycobacterium sp.]
DQQYVGGGYGWTNLGAPRAVPGSGGSAGVTLTPDSAPLPSSPFCADAGALLGGADTGHSADVRVRRTRGLLLGAVVLALLIGALMLRLGGLQQRDTPVSPAVVTATTPAPTTTAVSSAEPSPFAPPPAEPPVSTETMPTTPITTAQAPPLVISQIVTAPTTSAEPPPTPSVTRSSAPVTTTPPTSVRAIAPPTTSIPRHHGGNTGSGSGSRAGIRG